MSSRPRGKPPDDRLEMGVPASQTTSQTISSRSLREILLAVPNIFKEPRSHFLGAPSPSPCDFHSPSHLHRSRWGYRKDPASRGHPSPSLPQPWPLPLSPSPHPPLARHFRPSRQRPRRHHPRCLHLRPCQCETIAPSHSDDRLTSLRRSPRRSETNPKRHPLRTPTCTYCE